MSKLDAVIERLRILPAEAQDAIAEEIEVLLEEPPLLTEEQWQIVEARLGNDNAPGDSHDAVMAEMRARIGE